MLLHQPHPKAKWLFGAILIAVLGVNAALLQFPNPLNGQGRDIPEWPLLTDVLVTLPLIYLWMFKPTLRQFLLKWLTVASIGFFFGKFAIPETAQRWWTSLDSLHTYTNMAILVLETVVVLALGVTLVKLVRLSEFVDEAIDCGIDSTFGASEFKRLAAMEARVWYYGLLMRKKSALRFRGEQHFSYANNNGNASNQLGFISLILLEIPMLHLVLHFVWSPFSALLVSAVTLYSLLYLIADYRATLVRPISIDRDRLYVRCGALAGDVQLSFNDIQTVAVHNKTIRRQRGVRRFGQMGLLNVEIRLKEGTMLPGWNGAMVRCTSVHLSMDQPQAFARQCGSAIAARVSHAPAGAR